MRPLIEAAGVMTDTKVKGKLQKAQLFMCNLPENLFIDKVYIGVMLVDKSCTAGKGFKFKCKFARVLSPSGTYQALTEYEEYMIENRSFQKKYWEGKTYLN